MEYVKISLDRFGYYAIQEISSENLSLLAQFLTSDVISGSNSWKEWLLDEKLTNSNGNATSIEREGNAIALSDLYADEESQPRTLKIETDKFVRIFDQWQELCKESPKKIVISRKDDQISLNTEN